MTNNELESDLGYVRELVHESDRRPSPKALYLLWAGIILVGFSMADLARDYVGYFWMVAGPGGGILSGILGHRYGRSRGQINRALGIRHALHWGGMMVMIGFAILLATTGHIPGYELNKVILIIITFGWWTAGVHFDRAFLWLGGLLALGFLAVLFVPKFAWTGLGVVLSGSLIWLALRGGVADAGQEN